MWKYFMVDQRLSGKQKTKRFYKWYRLGVDNSDKWDSCWNFSWSSITIPISFSSVTWLISFSPILCFVLVAWPRCTYLHLQKTKRFYKWYRLGVDNSDKWDSSKKRSRFHIFFTIYINDLPDVVQNIAYRFLPWHD
jgi:hypothetical protein